MVAARFQVFLVQGVVHMPQPPPPRPNPTEFATKDHQLSKGVASKSICFLNPSYKHCVCKLAGLRTPEVLHHKLCKLEMGGGPSKRSCVKTHVRATVFFWRRAAPEPPASKPCKACCEGPASIKRSCFKTHLPPLSIPFYEQCVYKRGVGGGGGKPGEGHRQVQYQILLDGHNANDSGCAQMFGRHLFIAFHPFSSGPLGYPRFLLPSMEESVCDCCTAGE